MFGNRARLRENKMGWGWIVPLLITVAVVAVLAVIAVYADPYFWPAILIVAGAVFFVFQNLYGYIIGGLLVAVAIILVVLTALGYYILPSLSIVRCC